MPGSVLNALKTSSHLIFTQLYQGGVNITTFKQKKTKLNLWERKELGHGTQIEDSNTGLSGF